MTTAYGKMKNAKIAALQSEIHFYRNLIAEHDKQKSKELLAVTNETLANNKHALSNTQGNVPNLANNTFTRSNGPIHRSVIFSSKNSKLAQSSVAASSGTFRNRSVILNKIKTPAFKSSIVNSVILPVKPIAKKSSLSWKSSCKYTNKYKKDAVLYTKINNPIGNSISSSNVPKMEGLKSFLKDNIRSRNLKITIDNSSKRVLQSSQLEMKANEGKHSKSHSEMLCKEIVAITEQLKQASKTLSLKNGKIGKTSDVKLCTKSINSSDIVGGHVVKTPFQSVIAPKSSPELSAHKLKTDLGNKCKNGFQLKLKLKETKTNNLHSSCIFKASKLIPLQIAGSKQNKKTDVLKYSRFKLEKTIGNGSDPCKKFVKKLQVAQMVGTPIKVIKSPGSVKRKVSELELVSENLTDRCTAIPGTSTLQGNSKDASELQFKRSQSVYQRKVEPQPFKAKTKLLNSKYKVVNKKDLSGNLKNNPLKTPILKCMKTAKLNVSGKKKSTYEYMNKSKTLKMVDKFSFKSNPTASIGRSSSVYSKNFKLGTPLKKPRIHPLNSLSKSKYKVINGASNNSCNKVSKGLKSDSKKLFNFSTDVDLLMELAAENKSHSNNTPTLRNRSVLLKRVYKSKNTIINRNVSSARVKTAKMIKSKYFASNKRHLWHKQAKFRTISNFQYIRGGLDSFQTKFHSTPLYSNRIRSNHSKHKISNYANTSYFSRNAKKMQYPRNKFAFGTFKNYKRTSVNRAVFMKFSNKKLSTPVSKTLASRVLQHSINRVLTASVKKKMSKINTYCMFYNRFGRCNNGTKCAYIHDPSKIVICTRFLRGTCKNKSCLFSHEICPGKMAICSFFLSGSCTKTNCPYRHEMLSPGTELCKAFVQGYCPEGKQCKKAHILVCPDYVKGLCSKGNACAFPHPPPKEKKIIEKTEKCENLDTEDVLMERVSRYFQSSRVEISGDKNQASNSFVPKRKNLPEQPSFISLSFSDGNS